MTRRPFCEYTTTTASCADRRSVTGFGNLSGSILIRLLFFGLLFFGVSCQAATISGTIFDDRNSDGTPSVGEAISGILLQVFEDDGDGVLTAADPQFGEEITTGNDGVYAFANLDPAKGYFVVQPGQVIGDFSYTTTIGELFEPSGPVIMIDQFDTMQEVVATPLSQTSVASMVSSVLGGERDFLIQHVGGSADSQLRSNPYGLNSVLEFNQSAGVSASVAITWGGVDGVADSGVALGLNDLDLTNGGLNVGIEMAIGVDAAGTGDTFAMRFYEGSKGNFSEAIVSVPTTTNGTATSSVIVPFSAFEGPVSADKVDAIQLLLGGQQTSIDMQLDYIGVIGPHLRNMSVSAIVPEPSAGKLLKFMGIWFVFGALGFRRESWFPGTRKRSAESVAGNAS